MGRTSATGDELTLQEETLIANAQAGTYSEVVPTGVVNGANTVFTLPASPSPASSLHVKMNGAHLKAGGEDFTLSAGLTITFVTAPPSGSIILATFLVDTDT